MNISNIYRASTWFEVLQTNELSQAAVMTLQAGQATGAEAESHKQGQQVLLLIIERGRRAFSPSASFKASDVPNCNRNLLVRSVDLSR
jgi:hypothetical protein